MADRVLICNRGKLRFVWNIVSRQAEVYEMNGDLPVKRVGWLFVNPDGMTIEFEQEPFEQLCDEFLEMAGKAGIRTEGGPDDD